MQPKNNRKFSYRSVDRSGRPVPCLPLQGKFLILYGFGVGTNVTVQYDHDFIHISKIISDRYGDDFSIAKR